MIDMMAIFLAERVNNRYIQSALGHSSSKSREMYASATSIYIKTMWSPLDILFDSATFESDIYSLPT